MRERRSAGLGSLQCLVLKLFPSLEPNRRFGLGRYRLSVISGQVSHLPNPLSCTFVDFTVSTITVSSAPHLGPAHADDAVDIAVGVVEEGHGDRMFAGGDPIPFGGGVDLEDMGPGAEDRLLPGGPGSQS